MHQADDSANTTMRRDSNTTLGVVATAIVGLVCGGIGYAIRGGDATPRTTTASGVAEATPEQEHIVRVLKELAAAQRGNIEAPARLVTALEQIDTRGCPRDFAERFEPLRAA